MEVLSVLPDIKTISSIKTCTICRITKEEDEFYKWRNQCKKCFIKLANSSLTEEERKLIRSGKKIRKRVGIFHRKYDEIRESFINDIDMLNLSELSRKYKISLQTLNDWKRKGWLDDYKSYDELYE